MKKERTSFFISTITKLVTIFLGFTQLSFVRGSICPTTSVRWRSPVGVFGAIVDYDRSKNQLASHSDVEWPDQCFQFCRTFPNRNCAYWTWDGDSECQLYGCGVCSSSDSFNPNARYGSSPLVSGGGPGMDSCGIPSVKGDPHFTGGGNLHFDFTGYPDRYYCLVSDTFLHINAYFGGRYEHWDENQNKSLTWIRQVGVMWKGNTILMSSRVGERWQYDDGYVEKIEVNGQVVPVEKPGDVLKFVNDLISVKWVSGGEMDGDDQVDVYEIEIKDVLDLRIIARPEVQNLRTANDGVVHFTIQFRTLELTQDVHGVIGQTFRIDHEDRRYKQKMEYDDHLGVLAIKGDNAEGFLDGEVNDYQVSGIFTTDCKYSKFRVFDEQKTLASV